MTIIENGIENSIIREELEEFSKLSQGNQQLSIGYLRELLSDQECKPADLG